MARLFQQSGNTLLSKHELWFWEVNTNPHFGPRLFFYTLNDRLSLKSRFHREEGLPKSARVSARRDLTSSTFLHFSETSSHVRSPVQRADRRGRQTKGCGRQRQLLRGGSIQDTAALPRSAPTKLRREPGRQSHCRRRRTIPPPGSTGGFRASKQPRFPSKV